MKRIVVLSVVLLLAVGLVFAGGAKQGGGQSSITGSDGKIHITTTLWGSADELRVAQQTADKFNSSQDKIVVTPEQIPWETYEAVLRTRATAGQLPDTGSLVEQSIASFAASGLLADVSSMFDPNDMPLPNLAFKDPTGKVVAYSNSHQALMMYYNKDMFDKAGLAYPPTKVADAWTWDQFIDVAKKLTFDRNGRTPNDAGFDKANIVQYGAMVETLTWQLEVWCLSNGSGFYNKTGTEVTIDNPAAIEAIQKVADLHLVQNVAPFSPGLTDDGVQRSLIAGHVAMTTNGNWNVGTCLATARDQNGLNYGVGVLPYMKEKVTINTGGARAVFKGPKEAAAMEYVRWNTAIENSWNLIASGIWAPNKARFYTEEKYTREWLENPNYPPYDDFKNAFVDYARDYARPTAWYYTPNTNAFNALLQSLMGDVWTGAKSARDVITQNITALRNAHAGR